MDLLHHKMLKTGFLRCFGIPLDLSCFFFNLIAIKIIKMCLSRSQFCELQISNIINISGIFENCRNIRSNISFAVCNTNDHRTVFSCHPDLPRIILKHQFQSIRTAYTHHRFRNRIDRTQIIFLIIVVHQLDHNFCICLTVKSIAMF